MSKRPPQMVAESCGKRPLKRKGSISIGTTHSTSGEPVVKNSDTNATTTDIKNKNGGFVVCMGKFRVLLN